MTWQINKKIVENNNKLKSLFFFVVVSLRFLKCSEHTFKCHNIIIAEKIFFKYKKKKNNNSISVFTS